LIKIRLQRKGRIRRPIYHIVVADSRSPRDGRIIEQVGRYDGVTEKKETTINEERISYWLDNGAKPTDAVEKILRHEGFLYKRHLQMWGKSEEEITAALEEWKAAREAKAKTEVTRKEQVRATLIAEEKEVKKQIEQKASAAAAEMAQEAEKAAETEAAETTENEASEESAPEVEAEAKAEVATEETPSEEETVVAEETASPDAEAEVEEKTEESTEAVSEEVESTTTEDAAPVEQPEETSAETEVESVKSSADMTAKDAADHIAATPLEDLEGFVSEGEERKTVLAAWEAKKEA
jgi:small subunit ribosomal protein S16|tara:strand:+ start:7263 stop:8147 length:885 start_codon:yes stop_codon:yes gene_type:complete